MTRTPAIVAVALLGVACKGPVGPVVHVTVRADADAEVLSQIHGLSVVVTGGGQTETLEFPQGGPGTTPLKLPADFALVASEVSGTVTVAVTGLFGGVGTEPTPVAFGFTEISVSQQTLHEATVDIGVRGGCGAEAAPESDVPKVCFRRDGMELELGSEDPDSGNINNGIEFQDLDSDSIPDVLAAWSEDRNEASHRSGVSVFFGFKDKDRGVVYADETVFEDQGDPGERRSNTEAVGIDLVGANDGPADGKLDIVAASLGVSGLTIRPKLATRDFGLPVFFDLGKRPGEMQAADLLEASPGKELVVALRDDKALLIVLPATEERGLAVAEVAGLEAGAGVRGLHVADLDGKHGLDIVSAAKGKPDVEEDGQITVHLSDGADGFISSPVGEPALGWHDVRAALLNSDDLMDLVAVNVDRGVVGIFKGEGDGVFSPALEYNLTAADGVEQRPDRVRVGDLDGDGQVDILACGVGMSALHILLLGPDGAPRFPVIRMAAGEHPVQPGENLQGCSIADTTGDGVIDRLAITDRDRNRVRVFVKDR